ncbi:sulfite exporter TauE/SafE family protein [Bordetella hinzii]|uniref:sulfite exporter TauE/SafE family protein n=1 Tax=Bordetella hinzii TaxID=103855 RepID=UPI00138F8F66|nr:sulfite exporter TauE/SafE family protein [Bordetella hinzii]
MPWTIPELPGYLLLAVAAATFIVAGIVKGTLGVGLPLVAVPMLSFVLPPLTAISLLVVPVLASNFWQAIKAVEPKRALRRFRGLSAALCISTIVSVRLALSLPTDLLNLLVACSVVCAVILMVYRPDSAIPPQREGKLGVLVGVLAGAMGGVSSMTGPFIITYLLALRLPREAFIGGISIIYLFGMIPLYASLAVYGRLGLTEMVYSAMALAPMALGMMLGRKLRGLLSEGAFRNVLLGFLSMLALLLIGKGV